MKSWHSHLLLSFFCFFQILQLAAQSRAVAPAGSRCSEALPICDASPLEIAALAPCDAAELTALVATSRSEAATRLDFSAENGIWLKFKIRKSGKLLFKIQPLAAGDDLDFVLFRYDDCLHKTAVRTMAAGENLGETAADLTTAAASPCLGATGLADLPAERTTAPAGCVAGAAANFLSPVEARAGEWYALFVSNYDSPQGFRLDFLGSAATLAPICQSVSFENESSARNSAPPLRISELVPNPAQDVVQFEVESPDARACRVDLFSAAGVLQAAVSSQDWQLAAGRQWISLRIADLPAGVFYLRVSAGDFVETLRFVKN